MFIKKWFTNHKLISVLVVLSFIILGLPLIIWGIEKSFYYHLDPDIVYMTNALLYTKAKVITYIDHPGTPTILLLNYLYIPLRLMAKYIAHQNFVQWSFDNFATITYMLRFFQVFLWSLITYIFLLIVNQYPKSKTLVVTSSFLMILFASRFFYMGIMPENFSLLITAVWLVVFSKFSKTRQNYLTLILAAIAGFAMANKFTSLPLVIASISLPFLSGKIKRETKFITAQANLAISLEAFLIGIWPIRNKLVHIFNWGFSLLTHTGKYGTGTYAIFDGPTYLDSIHRLFIGELEVFIFVAFVVLSGIILVITKKIRILSPEFILMLSSMLSIFIFGKYSTLHYHIISIFLLMYCGLHFLSKAGLLIKRTVLLVAGILFVIVIYINFSNVAEYSPKIDEHAVGGVLQEWTPFWADDIYKEQLRSVRP